MKINPREYVLEQIIEARRLTHLARVHSGEAAVDYWIAAGLALGNASRLIGECVNLARNQEATTR